MRREASDPARFMEDPAWATAIPVRPAAAPPLKLVAHEDCVRLDLDVVQGHLRAGGTLGRLARYEERPGQIAMAGAVARAFNEREHLMIEAGTGVGKSLAYLIPSILWAWTNKTPVIVSTATHNLQSQLMSSDLPRACAVLGDDAAKIKVSLLKGRLNYVCLKSVDAFFSSGFWTLTPAEQEAMPAFIDWLLTTETGDLEGVDVADRSRFARSREECLGKKCPFFRQCFVYKARQRAAESHIVITNHALVLAEAVSSGGGILPGSGFLVLDEAHHLEDIATEQLTEEFSLPLLERLLKRIAEAESSLRPALEGVRRTAKVFLRFLGSLLPRDADHVRFDDARFYWDDREKLSRLQGDFETSLLAVVKSLHKRADALEEGEARTRLAALADDAIELLNVTAFVVKGENDAFVYGIERVALANARPFIRLFAAPLSVARALHEFVFTKKDSVILSSATLRVGSSFAYMASRVGFGLDDEAARSRSLTADSPFDYNSQVMACALSSFHDPAVDGDGYVADLATLLVELLPVTRGRALVLFTSYEMMNKVASRVRGALEAQGIRLLVQGERASRERMTAALRDGGQATVLFGAQSFWEGVDVAGAALSCVVLTRLPFAQKGDPLVEARCEAMTRQGRNAFHEYTLPEAVIRFRQGFGRLIRAKSDRGVVVMTDPRLMTKNYGALFRRSLPATVHDLSSTEDVCASVRQFFSD